MSSQRRRRTAEPGGSNGLIPPPFRCTSTCDGGRTIRVEASGELDLLTTPELERALRDAAAACAQLVVLDLRSLTFIDSSGVHAIEDFSLRARQRGGKLVVSHAPEHVVRLFALTGASRAFEQLDVGAVPQQLRLAG